MKKNGLLIALYVVGCLGISMPAGAGESPPLRKIRAAITSISGSMVPPWAAHEAGIFRKYGLQVEVIAMPSGIQGISALIAAKSPLYRLPEGRRQEPRSAAPTSRSWQPRWEPYC